MQAFLAFAYGGHQKFVGCGLKLKKQAIANQAMA